MIRASERQVEEFTGNNYDAMLPEHVRRIQSAAERHAIAWESE
jgi:hypothetical protein